MANQDQYEVHMFAFTGSDEDDAMTQGELWMTQKAPDVTKQPLEAMEVIDHGDGVIVIARWIGRIADDSVHGLGRGRTG